MKNILAIGAHSDDIEFGCAGTLIKKRLAGNKIYLLIMSCSNNINTITKEQITIKERSRSEAKKSADLIGAEIKFLDFISNEIPFSIESVTEIEKFIDSIDFKSDPSSKKIFEDAINPAPAPAPAAAPAGLSYSLW